jgi:hypothetical protein
MRQIDNNQKQQQVGNNNNENNNQMQQRNTRYVFHDESERQRVTPPQQQQQQQQQHNPAPSSSSSTVNTTSPPQFTIIDHTLDITKKGRPPIIQQQQQAMPRLASSPPQLQQLQHQQQQQQRKQHFTMHIQDPKNRTSYSTSLSGSGTDDSQSQSTGGSSEWKRGGKRIELSREDIERYAHLPQPEAAEKLGVSLSTLKRRYVLISSFLSFISLLYCYRFYDGNFSQGRWPSARTRPTQARTRATVPEERENSDQDDLEDDMIIGCYSSDIQDKMSLNFILNPEAIAEKFLSVETEMTLQYAFQAFLQSRAQEK